jgi:hypothetical protein
MTSSRAMLSTTLPVRWGGGAAGVVADHPADGAVRVGGGFRAEPQAGRRELLVQCVQHYSRLHHTRSGIEPDLAVDALAPCLM